MNSTRTNKLYFVGAVVFFAASMTARCGTDKQASSVAAIPEGATYASSFAAIGSGNANSNSQIASVDTTSLQRRTQITYADILQKVDADLKTLSATDQRNTRYFLLTTQFNGGAPDDLMSAFRHGLSKMVNSLSSQRDVVPPKAIDNDGTIFRINLRDYGWSRNLWEEITRRDPYGMFNNSQTEQEIRQLTQTQRAAFVRADWFASAGLRAPLYNIIMGLPNNIQFLEQNDLDVNVDDNVRNGDVMRAGFNTSGVSGSNRMVERHDTKDGGYWKSYDFVASGGRRQRNIFEFAFESRNFGGIGFDHAGGEMIWQLPNGLQGYMLTDNNGNRLDEAPVAIVQDPTRGDAAVNNGVSCFRCHHSGMIPFPDQIRSHVEKNSSAFSRNELEIVQRLYPGQQAMNQKVKEDNARFAAAVSKLGYPYRPRNGMDASNEPVYLLARQFESELPLTQAAAELGLSVADFQTQLARSRTLTRRLANVNDGGTLKRAVYEDNFPFMIQQFGIGRTFINNGLQ